MHHEKKTVSYRIVVLAKQVPDTSAVTPKAMNKDGTLNRAALPAVFNADDLHALEMALAVKETYGGQITVITMGPPKASDILREALYRGADEAILLTDRRFAAADTLATSYTLSTAIKKVGPVDLIVCGREASDGNTAQVGPQVAEKLGVPQLTSVEAIINLKEGWLEARHLTDQGSETVRAPLPLLITVVSTANEPRIPVARRLMRFKKAMTRTEVTELFHNKPDFSDQVSDYCKHLKRKGLLITEWDAEALMIDPNRCGRPGSPTWVKKIEKVKLTGGSYQSFLPTDEGIRQLMQTLIDQHTFG